MSSSLEQTFIRRYALVVTMAVLVLALLSIHAARRLLLADLHDKGEGMGRILSAVVLDSTMTHDYASIERYVGKVAADPFIMAVKVVREDGEILGASGEAAGGGVALSYPIRLGKEVFGSVELEFSLARVGEITRRIMGAALVALVIFLVLGVYVTRQVLVRTILTPLAELRSTMGTFGPGHFRRLEEREAPRELRAIVAAFNHMAGGLERSFAELEEQRSRLVTEGRKLAAIVNNIADGLFVTNEQGVIKTFNPSAEAISGYKAREVVGRSCHDVFRTYLCRDACAQAHGGDTMTGIETTLITKDGRLRQVAVSSAVFCDEMGEHCGGVQTLRDITEEKMRHELFCRTEKLAAVGQLAAGVAHEINNPLANILGYARLLRPGDDQEQVASRREVIIEQAEKCRHIVRGLLDYARSSDSRREEVDFNKIIRRVVEIMELQLRNKEIDITLELNDIPPLNADPRKLEQLFFNLLLNAVQAVEPGGVLEVFTRRKGEGVLLGVGDNGPGIAREIRCRVFDPFYTTKPVGQGTGLGLSICAGIVDELQGGIEIGESALGGAIFKITLPLK